MKAMSDLCWFCQRNTNLFLRSASQPEEVKSAAIKEAEEHLRVVGIERSFYKTMCDTSKQSLTHYLTSNSLAALPTEPAEPCSRPIASHYSFDMAQQVHYPCDPLQPGPMYFLTPRKCGIFGVCNEALPRQVNLLKEARDTSKGANNIISKLHYFFAVHGFGEQDVYLHADNCTGQNKNNALIHYLAWRVIVGVHRNITLSFLVVGHTKFSPDWCFGLFKKRFRRTKVGTLSDIARVVEECASVNIPQLCGTEDGTVIVPTYDWKTHFTTKFKTVPHIKTYHHFRFTSDTPGSVFVKTHADTDETQIQLLPSQSWSPSFSQLPLLINPCGLPPERQWYLYDHIGEFCPENAKDIVAPLPTVPKPGSSRPPDTRPSNDPTLPAPKRKRRQAQ